MMDMSFEKCWDCPAHLAPMLLMYAVFLAVAIGGVLLQRTRWRVVQLLGFLATTFAVLFAAAAAADVHEAGGLGALRKSRRATGRGDLRRPARPLRAEACSLARQVNFLPTQANSLPTEERSLATQARRPTTEGKALANSASLLKN